MNAASGKPIQVRQHREPIARPTHLSSRILLAAGIALQLHAFANGQAAEHGRPAPSPMQQHYDAAFRFQEAGNLSRANVEYKVYLGMILHRIANGHATLGDYALAVPIYDEALKMAPDDHEVKLDYAAAALDAGDWEKAKALATAVLASRQRSGPGPDTRAAAVLGRAQSDLEEHQAALEQFKLVAQLRPDFDSFSELAVGYLMVGDKLNASKVLNEIPARFGDTAALHQKLGVVYGRTQLFDDAVGEFKKAIARDSRLKGAHYSLGATYMMQAGEAGYDKAEAEFRKELELDPANSLAYAPLGRIAMSRHKYADAEADLKRALVINYQSAGTYLNLGQIYMETNRNAEAAKAFRAAISLTLDPSKNDYEVERAHFWLGRLLVERGDAEEGRRELNASRNLLYLKDQQIESRLSGNATIHIPLERTHGANLHESAALKEFERQAGPVIASSYDNLGANAANAGEFANASSYFEQAAWWNPALSGIDENWSRAAFAAKEYGKAVAPLHRILASHPGFANARGMLGLSLCMIQDYRQALDVLQPIETSPEAGPLFAIASAGSLAQEGDTNQAIARLKSLENSGPGTALVHFMLGKIYAGRKQYSESAEELSLALQLDPSSADTMNALALTDLELGRKAEGLRLLSDMAEAGAGDAEVHFRLARLQLELGNYPSAVDNLKLAIRLNPTVSAYHAELAEAYRKNTQPDDADREDRRSETLQAESELNQKMENDGSRRKNQSDGFAGMQKN
jgi:tetratricopeptide (TPR) repeat protein